MVKLNTEIPSGANSADAAHATAEESSAQALTRHAFKMLSDLDADVRMGIDKLERKHNKFFEAAFSVVYAAIVAIDDSGGRKTFLESRGIRPEMASK